MKKLTNILIRRIETNIFSIIWIFCKKNNVSNNLSAGKKFKKYFRPI